MHLCHMAWLHCAAETVPCLFSRHVLDTFCFGQAANLLFVFVAALERDMGSGNRLVLDDFFPEMIDFQNECCLVCDETAVGERVDDVGSLPLPSYNFFAETFGGETQSVKSIDG